MDTKAKLGTDSTSGSSSGSEIKPKPCCVCLDEKKSRDECLLFNGQESGKCDELISSYKTCMKGFGFETR